MRKRTSLLKAVFLIAALSALVACGQGSSDAPLVDSNGKHPAKWAETHGSVAALSSAACSECHGNDQSGGISRISCMSSTMSGITCHATSPVVSTTRCVSCHGVPPNGSTAPNRAGAHAVHLALTGITCDTCHRGAGFGTANHARANATGGIARATVSSLDAAFQAKTFTSFGYDAASGTCSGIICHGGVKTPQWDSATAISCQDCHALGTSSQVPQFNSFYSGSFSISSGGDPINLHQLHLAAKVFGTSTRVVCTDCHDSNTLALSHFTGLTSPGFEATSASTIGGGSSKITSYTPYTATVPSGSCTSSCHATNNNNPRFWVSP